MSGRPERPARAKTQAVPSRTAARPDDAAVIRSLAGKIAELVVTRPDKAAIILTDWIRRS